MLLQGQAHGQRAAHRAQFARQRQLACKHQTVELAGINLSAGGQDAQGNRQIKATRILGQIGRSQVDGDALVVRKIQPAVEDGRAHALAGLLDLDIGQPHQRETGQAVGHMHLNRDGGRLQPHQGVAMHQSKTHISSLAPSWCTTKVRGGDCCVFSVLAKAFEHGLGVTKKGKSPNTGAFVGWHGPC